MINTSSLLILIGPNQRQTNQLAHTSDQWFSLESVRGVNRVKYIHVDLITEFIDPHKHPLSLQTHVASYSSYTVHSQV